ncbi:tyrosine-type recombinase/integrase [Nocardia sp. A7]|uniref:tyrosine-type recombinase/integrase n=1 Tax=Nocardia sp. A7 TaxID=2789274 RepID=UPI00397B3FFE
MSAPRPRQRKDGTINWQVPFHYFDTDGVRRSTAESFDEDYEEAVWWSEYLDRHGLDRALAILPARRAGADGGVLLGGWLTDYADRLLKVGSISPPVHRKYLGYVRNDVVPFFGATATLDAVTADSDAAWIVFLAEDKGHKPHTIHNKHGFLSGGLRAAVNQRPFGLLPFNPCSGVRLPADRGRKHCIFDNDEWELFEELIFPRWRPQAEFGLVSMARPSEIGALLVRDVHPVTGVVQIDKAWKDAGSRLVLGPPKTERGERSINVPLQTLERLDLDRDGDEYLFCTKDKGPITAASFYEKAWQPALRRLEALASAVAAFNAGNDTLAQAHLQPFTHRARWTGVDAEELITRYPAALQSLRRKHLTPYMLRHTGISWKLQDGVPIFVVSRDAGHESVAVTDRVYGHNDRRPSESAAKTIGQRLPRVRAPMLDAEG